MKTKSLIGKSLGFEDENCDVKWTGVITKEKGDKVYVKGHKHITGWHDKKAITTEEEAE
jgi:hypothetical protein